MSVKLGNKITTAKKITAPVEAKAKSASTKKKQQDEDLDDDELDEKPLKKSSTKSEDDDDDDIEDDDWDKNEEEDAWDPDFEEFDLPKSKKGKASKGADTEEDFKIEEEEDFKDIDLFNDRGFDDEEEDF